MTISLAPVDVTLHAQSSPVAFADDAASAIATSVALEAGLSPEVAQLVQDLLAESMAPWFNRVGEIERGHVARYLNRLAENTRDGQMIGNYQADALKSAAERLVPQVHRAPVDATLAAWGPSTA